MPERVALRNEAAHEGLVDQHHMWHAPHVRSAEIPPAQEGNAHRLQVAGRGPHDFRLGRLASRKRIAALEGEAQV